jgi:hypothetical protein
MHEDSGGRADVVYGLILIECGMGVLAMLGELLFMGGNPLYVAMPIIKAGILLLFATQVLRGRRWAAVALIASQVLTLVGFWINLLLALLPQLTYSMNVVGLLTGVALPAAVIWLCARMLAAPRAVPIIPIAYLARVIR